LRNSVGCLIFISDALLWLLGLGIYIYTLYLAYLTSFPALLGSLALPGIAQVVWIIVLWLTTGTFFHLFTDLCIAWAVLLIISLTARVKFESADW
jgi:hypothetical protein